MVETVPAEEENGDGEEEMVKKIRTTLASHPPLSKIYQDFLVLRQSVQFVMVYTPKKQTSK